jgi:ArsR family transcriptional regulator
MGFSEVEVLGFLRKAGFKQIETAGVHREEEAPHFETMLATGVKQNV